MGFLSSCNWYLREPLMLPQGSQVPYGVAWGSAGVLLTHCRGIGPHLMLGGGGGSRVVSRVAVEGLGSSQAAMGASGNLSRCLKEVCLLSSCIRHLRIPIESVQGKQALSRVEWEIGVLSNCGRNYRIPLQFQWGRQAFS